MISERLFLGVEQSATGLKWVDRLGQREANIALAMAQNHGFPDLVTRVLAGRGVGLDEAASFMEPTIKGLMPDPASLTDMNRAAERIAKAIAGHEKVAIFGDYDVDGACSSAILSRFLTHYGIANRIYIPDRIFEGYGPNPSAMQELAAAGVADRHGRLRHQQRGGDRRRPRTAGAGCGGARSPSGRRRTAGCGACGGQSQPRGRSLRRRVISALPGWSSCTLVQTLADHARAAHRQPGTSRARTSCRCSTWWRWPPCAMWCR